MRFRTLTEHSRDVIARFDRDLRHLYVNPVIEEITGIPDQEFVGKTNEEMDMPKELCGRLNTILDGVFHTGQPGVAEFDFSYGTKTVSFHLRAFPEFGPDGTVETVMTVARDITKRKRLEGILREERKKFLQFLNALGDPVYIVNKNYRIDFFNQAMKKVFGEPGGKPCFDYLSGRTEPCSWCPYPDILSGRTIHREWRHSDNVYDIIDSPMRNADGDVSKVAILHDITPIKEAEELLRRSAEELESRVQERTRELRRTVDSLQAEVQDRMRAEHKASGARDLLKKTLASLDEVVFVVDPKTRTVVSCNEAVKAMFGYRPDEVIGKNTAFLYPSRKLYDAFLRKIAPGLQSGEPTATEHQMMRKDGTVLMTEHLVRPLRTATEGPNSVVSVVRDVTERLHAQQKLEASEKKYRDLAELLPQGLFEANLRGQITWANEAAVRLLRMKGDESTITVFDVVSSKETGLLRKDMQRIKAGEIVDGREYTLVRPDGSRLLALVYAAPLNDEKGAPVGFRGIVIDITERHRAEEMLRASEAHLRELSSRLLSVQEDERKQVAQDLHDSIGAILASIKMSLTRKLSEMREVPASSNISLEEILGTVKRAIDECRRIQKSLRPSLLDDLGLIATINWTSREQQKAYGGVSIEQSIEVEESHIPERLKTVIYRIVQEALNNVAKHSRANRVLVRLRRNDGMIELAVKDDGRGFDLKQVARRSRQGIGLDSMKERAELSGGLLSIDSQKGRGTTVRAVWPVD
jgi:PAS domain S-box-containing protein